jgi:hypothetical protein
VGSLDRAIVGKLLQVDLQQEVPINTKMDVFIQHLTPEERQHPLAAWIIQQRETLDWIENIGEFISAFWHLPPYPWIPTGHTPDVLTYREAAETLLTTLRSEGLLV